MSVELAYLAERYTRDNRDSPPPDLPDAHARFELMVRRHHVKLRRFAAGILQDRERIDDVLQEAYLKAYRRLPRRFANEAHEAVWLHRVVYRCCLDERRRVRRRPEQVVPDVAQLMPIHEERSSRLPIDRAFGRLSSDDRAVLLLVDLAGFDYAGAATVLRIPRGTVASRLNHARGRFRGALTEEGVR